MSNALIYIARAMGQLDTLFPELAEKEEALRLEREHAEYLAELKQGRLPPPQDATATPPPGPAESGNPTPKAKGVSVELPHMNAALAGIFRIMWDHWGDWDPRRQPKQVNIAADIDAALGWNPSGDGTPSRKAKAIASILKPDPE